MKRLPIPHSSLMLLGISAALLAGCQSDNNNDSTASHKLSQSTAVTTLSREYIDSVMTSKGLSALTGSAACDVNLYQIEYQSQGVNGEPVTVSAAVALPSGCDGPFPLIGGAHGTRTKQGYTEADPQNSLLDNALFAAHGYVTVNPDYLGLGTSDYAYHPYLHRDSEAQVMIDGLRAARELSKDMNVALNGQVMLKGYSQGGHTALAAQRAIEQGHLNEFNLVASAPMSGPYTLEQTLLRGLNPDIPNIAAGVLLAYLVQSYQHVYGDIYTDISEVFKAPYVSVIEQSFPGATDVFTLIGSGVLPSQAEDLLQPAFLQDFRTNADNPLRVHVRANEVLTDFTPQRSMMFCGSRNDGTVPFFNAEDAQSLLAGRGVQVPVIDVADMVVVPQGDDAGLTNHLQGLALCSSIVRQQLFDPLKAAAK